jgi:hypothetical protein
MIPGLQGGNTLSMAGLAGGGMNAPIARANPATLNFGNMLRPGGVPSFRGPYDPGVPGIMQPQPAPTPVGSPPVVGTAPIPGQPGMQPPIARPIGGPPGSGPVPFDPRSVLNPSIPRANFGYR